MSNKKLVFDPELLYRVTIDERARDEFISDNYDSFRSAFERALLTYGLPALEREDIIQDSIIKLREAFGNGNFKPEIISGGDLGRWALSIPINKAKDFLKSHRNPWRSIPLDTVHEDGELEGAPESAGLEDYIYETKEGPAHIPAHEPSDDLILNGQPCPDEYNPANLDAETIQQFSRADDGAARDRLLSLIKEYGKHPRIYEIVSLMLADYNLKEIAVKLGLSYSNTRRIWAQFFKDVREG